MQIVAKVIDFEISKRELERECAKLDGLDTDKAISQALNRLIDRCLLLAKALQVGIEISDTDYDNALLELIDQEEPLGLSSAAIQELTARELETLLRRQLIIKKYVRSLCPESLPITTEKLKEFYDEKHDIFYKPESVHCAHILFKGDSACQRAAEIRDKILGAEDFNNYSSSCSECPSNASCGDLGWFPKGKMIPEIDEVAFSLKVGEISLPFTSPYGCHILMLLDKKERQEIPFEEIRDSLYARLQQLEREFLLDKHVAELRRQFADSIVVYLTKQTEA